MGPLEPLQVEPFARWLVEKLGSIEVELLLAAFVLFLGVLMGLFVSRRIRGILVRLNVPDAVEGTPFERTAQRLGTSTTGIVSQMTGLFVFVIALALALRLIGVVTTGLYLTRFAEYLPDLFVAVLVLISGLIIGDKAELVVSDSLRSVKLPEVTLLPTIVKYSIFYVAALIALAQLGVVVAALLILLAAYAFGLFFIGGLAFKDMLSSSAAGIYLLLTQPYTIGDEVRIDGRRGIVQEMDVFVTRIESDDEEYIVPNRQLFREGIVRIRG